MTVLLIKLRLYSLEFSVCCQPAAGKGVACDSGLLSARCAARRRGGVPQARCLAPQQSVGNIQQLPACFFGATRGAVVRAEQAFGSRPSTWRNPTGESSLRPVPRSPLSLCLPPLCPQPPAGPPPAPPTAAANPAANPAALL